MPLLAAIAVALCTAMVLIVWSVMGGFLTMLLGSGRVMIGDLAVSVPVRGIPHYERLIAEIEADPAFEAATPALETIGLLLVDSLEPSEVRTVRVVGVEPESYDRVTGYRERLWWRPIEAPLPADDEGADPRLSEENRDRLVEHFAHGAALAEPDPFAEPGGEPVLEPAIVLGAEVTRTNRRSAGGFLEWGFGVFNPAERYVLSLLPLSQRGAAIGLESREFPVANEFRSGMFEVDANWVLLPIGTLQEMLKMERAVRTEIVRGEWEVSPSGELVPKVRELGPAPARATEVLVRAADPGALDAAEARLEEIVQSFAAEFEGAVPQWPGWRDRFVYQWEDRPGLSTFIQAVKKEIALVLVLFMFISLTAVFLITAIFWAMVSEKTKDIGILRAIGASRAGVAWLYLRYGLAIGVVGSALGGVIALAVVSNINPIHDWMGRALGLTIWDPSVYYFTEIPSDVEPGKAAIVLAGGVVFSVLGALVPALRAASMDPVRALRFE